MSSATQLIEKAFDTLVSQPGYVARADQRQLALLLADLIEEGATGAFEAPTGLGKSLAALIPAIAHGLASGKRTVIATYTNVLAEQYWNKDLPFALSLFEDTAKVKTQLLMGRSRYVCMAAVEEVAPNLTNQVRAWCKLGTESEFRSAIPKSARELTQLWQKVASPPVCPGRLCPAYDECFYFNARRGAERASVIITNHSVVLSDAILKRAVEEGDGMLGSYDFLILDEAHDFPQAAVNGLEFELSNSKLASLLGIAGRLEQTVLPLAIRSGAEIDWQRHVVKFRESVDGAQRDLGAYGAHLGRPGILDAAPAEVMQHPQVQSHRATIDDGAQAVADSVAEACLDFVQGAERRVTDWRAESPEGGRMTADAARNYLGYVREYGIGAQTMFHPHGVAVSYVGQSQMGPFLRQDVIDLAEPLRELIWDRTPWACLSATLAIDGSFDFFRRVTGAEPKFEEILLSPFDFASQAALYLPPPDRIPDPTVARREGYEDHYFQSLARELSTIIRACGGRTLALFHSRREMEAVFNWMNLPPELPVYTQLKYGASSVGEKFKANVNASMFALRSFWTGFDAPGETLSCVVLVRVPFEVPIDPPQIARLAYLQSQGRDAFGEHTLPNAKMLMRQGAGRLIRRAEDVGVIAILDPRVQTKRYGEEILANLPPELRTFRDLTDALGYVGIEA